MKKLIPCLLLGLLTVLGPATAELCSIDAVPAATLLLPYFEVDLDDPGGVTTLFSINNAKGSPALAHVTFWTDWSNPTLSFDVYLTGYDVVSVNVRDVFEGNIPITSDAPNDPGQDDDDDTHCGDKSPCGGMFTPNRHWDDKDPETEGEQGFPFCDQIFPGFVNPVITASALDRLHQGHTGQIFAQDNACLGFDHGDNIARGYITIDNANECSIATDPGGTGLTDTPYFADGGLGVASNVNQLWGDWSMLDPANAFAQGDTLVHIEAFDDLNAGDLPLIHPGTGATTGTVVHDTRRTFYGKFLGDTGRDNREPLGSIWAGRYLNGGSFDQTQLVVWRDSGVAEITPAAIGEPDDWCKSGPSWYPLDQSEVLAFNETEDAVEICFEICGISPPCEPDACFPLETGRYGVSEGNLFIPFSFGWMYLNLNQPAEVRQSHVTTLHSALGQYSVGLQAIEFNHACEDFNERLSTAVENGGTNFIPFF